MDTLNDPLGIVGKWFTRTTNRDRLIEVIKYSKEYGRGANYYECIEYANDKTYKEIYLFPWYEFEQLEM